MKGLGYTGFECNFRLVEDQFERAADARASIESTGVRLIGPHANMQQMPPHKLAKLAVGVVALGGQCIVMSGRGLAENGAFDPAALRKKAAELNTLGKVCKGQGLRLAYHNHNPEFANHNAEIEGLAEHTDPSLVSFLMDAGHGYLGGGDPAAFMTRHAARIYGIHLKTFRGKSEDGQVPLGQGDFDFKDLATAIRKTGWTGWLTTEEGGGPKTGNTAVLGPDREYIRKVFGV
jgi:inosose dehydratase